MYTEGNVIEYVIIWRKSWCNGGHRRVMLPFEAMWWNANTKPSLWYHSARDKICSSGICSYCSAMSTCSVQWTMSSAILCPLIPTAFRARSSPTRSMTVPPHVPAYLGSGNLYASSGTFLRGTCVPPHGHGYLNTSSEGSSSGPLMSYSNSKDPALASFSSGKLVGDQSTSTRRKKRDSLKSDFAYTLRHPT